MKDDLVIKRIEYILDPSASEFERMHRRMYLTNHNLRECIKALRDTARIVALESAMNRAITLIERNLYHQTEKVEDAKNILRAALETNSEG